MSIIASYYIREGNKRKFLNREFVNLSSEPTFGDVVVINGSKYEVTDARFDYEMWQISGEKIYEVAVRKL